jgi:hypothetical protein
MGMAAMDPGRNAVDGRRGGWLHRGDDLAFDKFFFKHRIQVTNIHIYRAVNGITVRWTVASRQAGHLEFAPGIAKQSKFFVHG